MLARVIEVVVLIPVDPNVEKPSTRCCYRCGDRGCRRVEVTLESHAIFVVRQDPQFGSGEGNLREIQSARGDRGIHGVAERRSDHSIGIGQQVDTNCDISSRQGGGGSSRRIDHLESNNVSGTIGQRQCLAIQKVISGTVGFLHDDRQSSRAVTANQTRHVRQIEAMIEGPVERNHIRTSACDDVEQSPCFNRLSVNRTPQ